MSDASTTLLPLVLSAKKVAWRSEGEYEGDKDFARLRPKVLMRDEYRCRFCGFKAMSFQEIHHLNDDHTDHTMENLITACVYCHMCNHIGLAGAREEATLIWLPEIEQVELNQLVRAIQIAKTWKSAVSSVVTPGMTRGGASRASSGQVAEEFADVGNSLENLLLARGDGAKERIGTNAPETLANVLLRMNDDDYGRRSEILAGIRLLPLGRRVMAGRDIMPDIMASWTGNGGEFSGLKPPTWGSMLRSRMDSLRNA